MKNNFSIGNVFINGNVVLAPMASITDMPYRLLARQGGASLVCSEMISAKALCHHNKKTENMLIVHQDEHPVSMQIFSGDPESMRIAAEKVEAAHADIIDINLGCPVKKVKKSGSGVALASEDKWIKVVRAVVKSVRIPVTIKIRTGLTADHNTAPYVCSIAEQVGVSAVAIHARPASQHHTGPVFWEQVRDAVEKVTIPVIVSGGIYDGPSAKKALQQTGCAAVMIGRAAFGDFNIFKRIQYFLDEGISLKPPSTDDKINTFLKHLKLNCDYYGEAMGIKRLRKIIPYYIKGLPEAASLRNELLQLKQLSDIENLIKSRFLNSYFEV